MKFFSKISQKYPALTYRDFRLMWAGQTISQAGNQMQIVAISWQLYLITHSAVALGLVGFLRFVPIVIFSLLGGSFADSFNRKKVQYFTQTLLTISTLFLAITTATGTITPMLIYIVTVITSALVAFDLPARQAMLPTLVKKEHFTNALSLWSIAFQTSTIIGPTIAGLLIARAGIAVIYGYNSLSFLVFLTLLFFMKNQGDTHMTEKSDVSFSHIIEGLTFIKSKTIVWSTMLLDFFATFFSSATALMPIFAKDVLHVGPEGLGILYAAPAVGAILAGLAVAHIGEIKNQGKVLLTSVFFYGVGTIIFGFSNWFPLSLLALFIIGAGDSVSAIIRNLVRQIATPDEMRGRMTSINMIFFLGGPQLGDFEAGLLAGAMGGPFSVVVGGVGTLVVILMMAWKIPYLRLYKNHKDSALV